MHSRLEDSEASDIADESMAALRASKQALRARITQVLNALPEGRVHSQSQAVAERLFSTDTYRAANTISVYLSMEGKEVQTRRIVKHALQNDKTVFVPYIHKFTTNGKSSSKMAMLALNSIHDHDSFKMDNWGIPTIPFDTVAERENCFGGLGLSRVEGIEDRGKGLDLIVLPGMAFDRHLGRLGHGKGYYDRFLGEYKQRVDAGQFSRMPFLVALALDDQVLDESETVPQASHDWSINQLLAGNVHN